MTWSGIISLICRTQQPKSFNHFGIKLDDDNRAALRSDRCNTQAGFKSPLAGVLRLRNLRTARSLSRPLTPRFRRRRCDLCRKNSRHAGATDLTKVRSTQVHSGFSARISATSSTDRAVVDPVSCRLGLQSLPRPAGSGSCARPAAASEHQRVSLTAWIREADCGSTSPRSLDERARLRTHTAHHSKV
jgi:hypothetical protein